MGQLFLFHHWCFLFSKILRESLYSTNPEISLLMQPISWIEHGFAVYTQANNNHDGIWFNTNRIYQPVHVWLRNRWTGVLSSPMRCRTYFRICSVTWPRFSNSNLVYSHVFIISLSMFHCSEFGRCIDPTGCSILKPLVTKASCHVPLDSHEGAISRRGIPFSQQTSITSCRITPGRTPSANAAVWTSMFLHFSGILGTVASEFLETTKKFVTKPSSRRFPSLDKMISETPAGLEFSSTWRVVAHREYLARGRSRLGPMIAKWAGVNGELGK